jgi:hypothetical protein
MVVMVSLRLRTETFGAAIAMALPGTLTWACSDSWGVIVSPYVIVGGSGGVADYGLLAL